MTRSDVGSREGLVLIDGLCVLCSASFHFVARRDHTCRFRFAALQHPTGRAAALAFGIDPDDPDTFAVVLDGRVMVKSDGAIAILRHLPGWQWTMFLLAIPRPVRDWVYDRIARNRYRLFGRRETCMVPNGPLAAHLVRSAEPSMAEAE